MAARDPTRILQLFTFARNTWKTLLNRRELESKTWLHSGVVSSNNR